ncbi:MAG: ribosome assembly factor SBDS [Candidatus Pacearchaeota archaeon]
MVQTTARIKHHGKNFEIIVDLDKALKYKNGESKVVDFLEAYTIFTDVKKGLKASIKDIEGSFGTTDLNIVARKIVKEGEILLTQEYREKKHDEKFNQIVDIISKNAIDPTTGNPHTSERIKKALQEAHINIKNTPIEDQIKDIITKLSKIIPIKMEEKKYEIIIPSIYTGHAYGIISPYKEEENWLNNGDLSVVVTIPSGIVFTFFDKLNSLTHGSVVTRELKE